MDYELVSPEFYQIINKKMIFRQIRLTVKPSKVSALLVVNWYLIEKNSGLVVIYCVKDRMDEIVHFFQEKVFRLTENSL